MGSAPRSRARKGGGACRQSQTCPSPRAPPWDLLGQHNEARAHMHYLRAHSAWGRFFGLPAKEAGTNLPGPSGPSASPPFQESLISSCSLSSDFSRDTVMPSFLPLCTIFPMLEALPHFSHLPSEQSLSFPPPSASETQWCL